MMLPPHRENDHLVDLELRHVDFQSAVLELPFVQRYAGGLKVHS